MALASGDLLAFRILESRYHVEMGPDKYIDQLVLRCDDGRTVTVPCQSQLAESCGEDLMGNVTLPAATTDAVLAEEQQKQTMLAQLRSLYGNISEKQVEFISEPSGLSTRFKPPMVAVLTGYELSQNAQDKTFCGRSVTTRWRNWQMRSWHETLATVPPPPKPAPGRRRA